MHEERSAPKELRGLVAESLAPRTIIEADWWDFDTSEWRFRLGWSGRHSVLRIPVEHWEDKRLALISLLATLATPAPETTLAGRSFWLILKDRQLNSDAVYTFGVLSDRKAQEKLISVKVTGSAQGMLLSRLQGSDVRVRELSVAIWVLKGFLDGDADCTNCLVNGWNLDRILTRQTATDNSIRRYVGEKLYAAYQTAGLEVRLILGETDFGYLGISEDDFLRAVSLRNGQDWNIEGLTLSPTREFIERCDASNQDPARRMPAATEHPLKGRKDLFVSYSSEDKKTLVKPLVEALKVAGLSVWFDEYELVLGDSLREKIDDGLRNSTHGIVVLSHSFFEREWPRKELDGLFSLMGPGRRIMPIWHELSKEELSGQSPILAGIVGIKSSEGIEKIVEAVTRALGRGASDGSARVPPTAAEGAVETRSRPSAVLHGSDALRKLEDLRLERTKFHINPIIPVSHLFNEWRVDEFEQDHVRFCKVSSSQIVIVPLLWIREVRRDSLDRFLIVELGDARMQWTHLSQRWQCLQPRPNPATPAGFGKAVGGTDVAHVPSIGDLKARGYELAWNWEYLLAQDEGKGWEVIYGDDGLFFFVQNRLAKQILLGRSSSRAGEPR